MKSIHRIFLQMSLLSFCTVNAQNLVNEENVYLENDGRYYYLESKYILPKSEFPEWYENEYKLDSINCESYYMLGNRLFCYKNAHIFTGKSRIYKKDSIAKTEFEYKNGIRISKASFFQNPNIISYKIVFDSLGNYLRTYSYNKQGRKSSFTEYKEGKRNGVYELYNQEGTLRYQCTYKNGKKDGLATTYSETGEKCMQTEYKGGKKDGKEICFCPNSGNEPTVKTFKNGKK